MKKTFALLLIFIFLLSAFNGCVTNIQSPQDAKVTTENANYSPNPASDFEYVVNSEQSGILINKYIGTAEHVVIPSHINNFPVLSLHGIPNEDYPTTIAEGTFERSNIKTIVIPETVTAIGATAFNHCEKLTTITFLPNSNLIYINDGAFANCVNLEKIDLSETQIKGIGTLAFRGCTNLKEVTFSNTLVEIREKAFYECSALLEIDFPQSLTKIAGGAFAHCSSLKRVAIPTKLDLKSFDEAIFHNVPALEQVIFKDGREEITGYALFQTDASVEIIVPTSVKRFSPLPFLINPSTHITLTFLGDAPEIVDDDTDWFGNPIINYDQNTNGWDEFSWNGKYTVNPIQKK